MKHKTKRRLITVFQPFVVLWAVAASIVLSFGLLLETVACLMMGDKDEVNNRISELINTWRF